MFSTNMLDNGLTKRSLNIHVLFINTAVIAGESWLIISIKLKHLFENNQTGQWQHSSDCCGSVNTIKQFSYECSCCSSGYALVIKNLELFHYRWTSPIYFLLTIQSVRAIQGIVIETQRIVHNLLSPYHLNQQIIGSCFKYTTPPPPASVWVLRLLFYCWM